MAKLIVHRPDGAAEVFPLDRDRTTIGRRADNDLCLAYPPVSAEHAVIVTIGEDSFLEDLGSTNGTLVNGERIARHFLRDGDVIDVGRLRIDYVAHDETTLEPTPETSEEPSPDEAAERAPAADRIALEAAPQSNDEPLSVSDAEEAADEAAAPADDLLADLMESRSTASAALDLTPTLSVVQGDRANGAASPPPAACVTILTGPHAGKATPMNKAQFVFGRPGVSVAAIRRSGGAYRLVPLAGEQPPVVNGGPVDRTGAELAFGDTIEVAGVKLRFERRA